MKYIILIGFMLLNGCSNENEKTVIKKEINNKLSDEEILWNERLMHSQIQPNINSLTIDENGYLDMERAAMKDLDLINKNEKGK